MSAKHPFAIVVDGTTVLAPDARRDLDIRFLPLHVSFGAESYTAGVDLSSEQFYARIAQPNARPTTSQPSMGECREIYEEAVRDGYDKILVLTVATEFSGTYSVATTTGGQILGTEIVVAPSIPTRRQDRSGSSRPRAPAHAVTAGRSPRPPRSPERSPSGPSCSRSSTCSSSCGAPAAFRVPPPSSARCSG